MYKGFRWRWPQTEDDLQWKTTSKYEKWNISATSVRILLKFESEAIGINSECTKVSNQDDLNQKTTSNGRQPQNLKSGISQQPLVGSYSNSNLKLIGSTQIVHRYQIKMTSNVKQPPTEDDLKIWKVEYLSIHWSDLTQIWNCSYWDQIRLYTGINWGCLKRKKTSNGRQPQYMKSRISQQPQLRSYSNLKLKPIGSNQSVQRYQMKMTYNGRQSPLEDNLKIWKVEYINNHWSYLTQIWNLNYWDQTRVH